MDYELYQAEIWAMYADYDNTTYPAWDAALGLQLYLSPVLLIVGTINNVVLVILMCRMCSLVSSCMYLALAAVCDTFMLYIRCGNEWLIRLVHRDLAMELMTSSDKFCKVEPFLTSFLNHLSRWLIVALAVEAVIAIVFPRKMATMLTITRARNVIMLLLVILISMNTHYFWWYELNVRDQGDSGTLDTVLICTFNPNSQQYSAIFAERIFPTSHLLSTDLLPLFTISLCTALMAFQIRRGRHHGSISHQAWCERYLLDPEGISDLKMSYVMVCCAYITLMTPIAILQLANFAAHDLHFAFGQRGRSRFLLVNTICYMLMYVYYSCKLFLILAISQRSRKELRQLFCYLNKKLRSRSTAAKDKVIYTNTFSEEEVIPL